MSAPLDHLAPSPLTITIVLGPWCPTPPGPAGAVERVWTDLAAEFRRKGHTVTLISKRYADLPTREERSGVRMLRVRGASQGRHVAWDLLKDVGYSTRALRTLPKADVVMVNTFWLPAMIPLLKKSAGKIAMNIQRVPKGQMWLYRRVHRLSAVSTAIADAIIAERPALAPKVRVIPNPIDLRFFKVPAQRHYEPTPGKQRTIVFTGRLHPEKGCHVLVEAFTRLAPRFPDLALRLVGPWQVDRGGGGQEYVDKLKALAGSCPVTFDQPIYDREQLSRVLQDATFYCYPTLAEQGEAQPVAPMEAMACGMAPVVSDIPQFRDYLTPGENGVTFDHRATSSAGDLAGNLASALESLISDPAKARAMGERAAHVAQRFSYELVAQQYLDDFASLLREPTLARPERRA